MIGMKRIEFKATDSEGVANNSDPSLVVLQISREEVEAKNVAHPLDMLMVLTDNKDKFFLYKESLVVVFDGYEDDPREMAQIPEVRKYIKHLVEIWPYFPWFMVRNAGCVALLLSFLCECIFFTQENGEIGLRFNSPSDVKKKIADMIERSLVLISKYEVSVDEFIKSLESFSREVGISNKNK